MRETADVLERLAALEGELARLKTLVVAAHPGTSHAALPPDEQGGAEPPASRRDLLRYGAAALGAAAAAAITASPAEAADGGPLLISSANTGTGLTRLTTTGGVGLWLTASGYGVVAEGTQNGVYAATTATESYYAGVNGVSYGSGQAPGVAGYALFADAPGVYGNHPNGGNAVRAEVPSYSSVNAIALYALNYSSYAGGGPGAGGFAIYGLSAKGHGLVGATAAAGAAAVVGASNGVAGAYAGMFFGPVIVSGTLTVVGGAKSAAVPHPDGSHRRLYCVESPESWFEDFGRGTLACGEAAVRLDPDFAAVVDASDYLVFVTGNDGRSDLSVCDRTGEGFRVKSTAGDVEGTFSWRVVAKRKDIVAPRFEPVEIPKEPAVPAVPASVYAPPPSPPQMPRRGPKVSQA